MAVLNPTLPLLATLTALAGAPASTSKTIVPVSSPLSVVPRSTNARKFAPPPPEAFALIVQSLVAKPADVLVSLKLMRVLFSFSLIVSKPKLSLFTQSRPTHKLP